LYPKFIKEKGDMKIMLPNRPLPIMPPNPRHPTITPNLPLLLAIIPGRPLLPADLPAIPAVVLLAAEDPLAAALVDADKKRDASHGASLFCNNKSGLI
jgi:hypothetical protein